MDEIIDKELAEMVRFTDATAASENAQAKARTNEAKQAIKRESKPVEASWEPVKENVSWRSKMIGCVKWACVCGGISSLMLYFQINQLMAPEAAVPCIVACGILGGFGVGLNAAK